MAQPDNTWICTNCNRYIRFCDQCISDWPMGRASWCCTEDHKSWCQRMLDDADPNSWVKNLYSWAIVDSPRPPRKHA